MGHFLQSQPTKSKPLEDTANPQKVSKDKALAYEEIYHAYADELYRYAYMIVRNAQLAEDVIHDVFTDLWTNKENLEKVRSIRLYLFSSIKRRALRRLKKERTFIFFDQGSYESYFEIIPSFLDELSDVQHKEAVAGKINDCIAKLSNRQREIIYLKFYQNMSYTEISQLLELDQKYVYNLASKAFCTMRHSFPQFAVLLASLTIYIESIQ